LSEWPCFSHRKYIPNPQINKDSLSYIKKKVE
jgi:hypothetical protein